MSEAKSVEAVKLGKKRWAGVPKDERTAHAKMMLKARRQKRARKAR